MKTVTIIYETNVQNKAFKEKLVSAMEELFRERNLKVTRMEMIPGTDSRTYSAPLENNTPDFLCTLDMAGFQIGTLQEVPFYDICRAKQMHIVLDEGYFKLFADKPFALNLYMFIPGNTEKLRKVYPDVPNLFGYPGFSGNSSDKSTLERIIDLVLKEAAESEKNSQAL